MSSQKKLVIPVHDETQKEVIIAWLSAWNIDSIVEGEDYLDAYTPDGEYQEIIQVLEEKAGVDPKSVSIEEVEDKNWNAEWEANFQPIEIDNVYVRATFHEPAVAKSQELIISPKMAFGTGHHATTYMMISYMDKLDLENKTVLDYGCGTGILAVFARMKKCGAISAIDIQEEAIENTFEHFELNKLEAQNLEVLQGDLAVLGQKKYQVVLANINRHVLLEQVTKLKSYMAENGLLIMSGILQTDRELILKTYTAAGYTLKDEESRGEWCRFSFTI